MLSSDFKTTSAPVVLDFLIRHGLVSPENGNVYFRDFSEKSIEIFIFLLWFRTPIYKDNGIIACSITEHIW